MQTKVCKKCGIELDVSMFNKVKDSKDGYRYRCRECEKEYRQINKDKILEQKKRYRSANESVFKERTKKYRQANREILLEKNKEYYNTNKEAIAERNKKYLANNKEIKAERGKRYYRENKEKIAEKAKQYRELNKEKIAEQNRLYAKNNRNAVNIKGQRRLAKKRALLNDFTTLQWEEAKLHFNNKCAYCGKVTKLAQEHFIALNKGGGYTVTNIIPSCKSCNSSKHDRDFFEWYPKQKYYSKEREKAIIEYLGYTKAQST